MYYHSHSSTYYHANKPTKAAVNNETRIPDNSIIGTYLDTKSDVFLSTMPFQCTHNHTNR